MSKDEVKDNVVFPLSADYPGKRATVKPTKSETEAGKQVIEDSNNPDAVQKDLEEGKNGDNEELNNNLFDDINSCK